MQLRKQYKHLWFVFLMIFFIGGSSVAVAAVQSLQSDQTTSTTLQTMSCHDQQMMDQHHQMPHAHSGNFVKCHEGMMQDSVHCQDCNSSSHCQTVNLAVDQQTPSLSTSSFLELSTHINTAYQARHLAGYWQEILRPPRT
ncbi:hypothetical protein [Acinetobacter dispersus]|uniref:DUF2946 domain-containing protein n=1 Tax=Acinetobacter dispersus TaxID=70348 RepID=N9MR82_9GAMM|nr:hypothetical protein [Acinetobacter dispersus]ENW93281.1 hypothetical protein F904_03232 [Acinetobacter dispersus]MCH7391435.1 hypothetical protein [Acinetobacter dispersus]